MVLPVREGFGPKSAGAIAMVTHRYAKAAGGAALVLGGTQICLAYPDVGFQEVAGSLPWIYGINVLRRSRGLQPEIIEVHQQPRLARLLARVLPRSRVLLFLHNDPVSMRGLRSATARQHVLDAVHRVVCVSAYLRGRYMSGIENSSKQADVLYNPLDLNYFLSKPTERKREILYAGRIVANKGVEDFIAACRMALPSLPGWSARIIGGDRFGPNSPETTFFRGMRDAAKAANILFDGPQSHDYVMNAMAEAAIVVVPSRWPEPFGLTALEAMASGAALVVSRTGGLPEVAGGAARYIAPCDVADLTAAIRELALDATLRARQAEAGLLRAKLFDLPVIAAQLHALRGPISAL